MRLTLIKIHTCVQSRFVEIFSMSVHNLRFKKQLTMPSGRSNMMQTRLGLSATNAGATIGRVRKRTVEVHQVGLSTTQLEEVSSFFAVLCCLLSWRRRERHGDARQKESDIGWEKSMVCTLCSANRKRAFSKPYTQEQAALRQAMQVARAGAACSA